MESKLETLLTEQQERVTEFSRALSTAANAGSNSSNALTTEHVSNTLQLFLHSNSRLQKAVNEFMEHQKISKDIENLESQLSVVNDTIKSYVKQIS